MTEGGFSPIHLSTMPFTSYNGCATASKVLNSRAACIQIACLQRGAGSTAISPICLASKRTLSCRWQIGFPSQVERGSIISQSIWSCATKAGFSKAKVEKSYFSLYLCPTSTHCRLLRHDKVLPPLVFWNKGGNVYERVCRVA